MDFNNFNGYITLINDDITPNDFKYFEVNKAEIQMEIPGENFNIENISDFYIEANCCFLKNIKTPIGKNLNNQELLGFITNIKVELKEIVEYSLDTSEINVLFNEDCIGTSFFTHAPILYKYKPYFYLNFAHIFEERTGILNISIIYTVYII